VEIGVCYGKLFGECRGRDRTVPLGLDCDGFLDVASRNGFSFAGFLEPETPFKEPWTWSMTRGPATYNSSRPAPVVPDLRCWLWIAEQHAQERARKRAQSEERDQGWEGLAEWFHRQRVAEEQARTERQGPAKKQRLAEAAPESSEEQEVAEKRRPARKQKKLVEAPESPGVQGPVEEPGLVGSQSKPYAIT
jgi:hypothetical protein